MCISYVPLTLKLDEAIPHEIILKKIKIDEFTDDFIPSIKKVLIVDTAGMGKSTILKRLFLKCMEKQIGIPVFIELRKLTRNNNILDQLYKDLTPIDEKIDKEFVLELIKRGDFTFYLDGFLMNIPQ